MNALSDLARDLKDAQPLRRERALRRAFHLALLALLLPGLLLGAAYQFTRPASLQVWTAGAFIVGAALLAYWPFRMASQATQPITPPGEDARAARLTAALQLGSAPAIPALFALVNAQSAATLLGCLTVSVTAYLLARARLRDLAGQA